MKKIRILFIAASNRVSLLERFISAAKSLDVTLDIWSLEDENVWHVIGCAGLAKVVPAPKFDLPNFDSFLLDFVKQNKIDIVIPIIDRATIVLSRVATELRKQGVMPIVSNSLVCETMADKLMSNTLFNKLDIKVPSIDSFPILAKPRFGASSRGIVTLNSKEELEFWKKNNHVDGFLLQSFVEGTEYSVDAYIDQKGRILGIVSRARILVSGGEVMVGKTEYNESAIALTKRLLEWSEWRGPVTVQVICNKTDAWLIECNPRFGGGVTLSIEAGLVIPEWILRERLGLSLPDSIINWRDGLCMTRARKDYFIWL